MEWRGRRGSRNIEDRRGTRSARGGVVTGGLGVIVVLLLGAFLGVDVTPLLQDQGGGRTGGESRPLSAQERDAGQFVSVTLADTEEVWAEVFRTQVGRPYRPPVLVLFSDVTQSDCGGASGATGPFYCPADRKAYLDTAFFATLAQRLGAPGNFAAAYVVGHEIAHHVQNELGILARVHNRRRQVGETESNALSVMTELQADCLAGIWAARAKAKFGAIDAADVEDAVNTARRIGDNTLQAAAGRRPMPHTFTHGTSDQRARWFLTGFRAGHIDACDTFSAPRL